jgi:pyridinium-3,5-bisthiocarboxylic acid mononucleotide nickel chelatase
MMKVSTRALRKRWCGYQRIQPMRIAYLDCFSGISGDMFLGALVDAEIPLELLQRTVAGLNLDAGLEVSKVVRNGISATKVDVIVDGRKDLPREEFWAAESKSAKHTRSGKARRQNHAHYEKHSHARGRHLSEILTIIAAAPISEGAKQTAGAIFTALGEAEAKVHSTSVEEVHFHEVGAADAIVDIVCAAVGAEALQVERILASPLNVGDGTVKCAHGVMPIPAPATAELLKGIPIYSGEVQKELVTPTGAAIVRTLVTQFGHLPRIVSHRIGYGAGTRDFEHHPNVLRLILGEAVEADLPPSGQGALAGQEEILVLEANLDDLNPQVIAYAAERLFAAGALDVFTTAIQMKKGRPATLVTVLASQQNESAMRDILFAETSTLGVRSRREQRAVLSRRHETVSTPWGEVRIKIGSVDGAESQVAPEYEDCRRIAAAQHVPLKKVMQEALRLYLDKKNG